MKRLIACLLLSAYAWGAIPSATIWELRKGAGADTQGGAFVAGIGGTDIAASATLSIDASNNKLVTSSAHNFVAGDVGKWLTVTASPILSVVLTGNGTSGCSSATIAFSGGAGSGATATATVSGGIVTSTTVTAGGTGYTSAPTATFTGTGCAATPTGYVTLTYTLGWYQVLSTAANAGTLDFSPGPVSSTAGTYTLYSAIDYSQQDAKNTVGNNISTTDAATTNTTTLTSATATFTSAIVGNVIYLTIGGGSCSSGTVSTQRREVTVFTNSTTVTLDATPTGSGVTCTGVTMNIGGALDSIGEAATYVTQGNKLWAKASATYTQTATVTLAATGSPAGGTPESRLSGYTTTRGDGGRATIQLSTNSALIGLSVTGNGWTIEYMTIDCNSLTTSTGVDVAGGYSVIQDSIIKNCASNGVRAQTNIAVRRNEFTGMTSAATAAINIGSGGSGSIVSANYVHDNATLGISGGSNTAIIDNVVSNGTGASTDGITVSRLSTVIGNVVYKMGRDGISASTALQSNLIRNNILARNGRYGIFGPGSPADASFDGNGFYDNVNAPRNSADDRTAVKQNGQTPYLNTKDVVISGAYPANDPFTTAASDVFTLNSTAGAGALLRGTALPGTLLTITGTGYRDFGVFQHQDPAGTGGQKACVSIR